MSRNFELFKRIEADRGESQNKHFDHVPTAEVQREAPLPFVEEDVITQSGQPSASLEEVAHEELVMLVHRVFLATSFAPRMVVMAGVEWTEGSGGISACVAEILASQTSGRVGVVDADLRMPVLHRHFGVSNEPGLAEAMTECRPARSYARRLGKNLWLVSAGATLFDKDTPLPLDDLLRCVAELRRDFDHVIVNTTPVNGAVQSVMLGRLADGMVLVLEANTTRREAALKAKQLLDAAGVKLLGAVLNNRTFPVPERIYQRL
jgi:Mrp family chromosome partitioning ATPase